MGNKVSNIEETRTVIAGIINNADKKRSNIIKTSKYSLITFFPKNILEQFRRLANFYFIIVTLIAVVIDSPVSPITSLAPLCFVIAVTMIKQGYEDWLRHRMDNSVNNELVHVIQNSVLHDMKSRDIRPGQLVKIKRDNDVPCDAIILWSSDSRGKCFVTTANLDGETSLKPLKVPSPLAKTTMEEKNSSSIKIEFSQPESDIYTFFGRLNIDDGPATPLGTDNLLLRGSRLKNTEWVIGCAIYTGKETKLALNSHFTSNKFTSCERNINNFLIFFIVVMVIEIIISYVLKRHLEKIKIEHDVYLGRNELKNTFKSIAQDAFSFLLLYYYVIPISLYVTIEMQKFIGSKFFEWDEDLYSKENDQPAVVNTSDLNEELGQIEILFSDKTGTLTKNDMYFQMCSINGKTYIEKNTKLYEFDEHWLNDETVEAVTQLEPDVQFFFTILSICHSVQVEEISEYEMKNTLKMTNNFNHYDEKVKDIPTYQSISSDEIAFVKAAANRGIVFYGDDASKLFIKCNGNLLSYEKLNTLEFTSLRKRMSVIVRDETGQIWLFCKGAESSVLPLCLDSSIYSNTDKDVQYFAEKGLRTLAVAYKKLNEDEYSNINEKLIDLNMNMHINSNPESILDVWRSIENGLTLLGATGVEDRLQDDVIETMTSLRLAGIKIWVLTGDKVETAINVAQSCGHMPKYSEKQFLTNIKTLESLEEQLNHCISIINTNKDLNRTLVVDGQSLGLILNTENESKFSDLSLKCDAVICCRLSPLQKALIIRLIKKSPGSPITAAVGDGANDISMIQEAHVGLGIFGKEGRQAARSADFAFSEFKMLKKIFLVHGHWYYQRLATLVQYSFYKNLAFSTLMLLLQINSIFSTQSLFDSLFLSLFNLVFASLPILLNSLSEQCHSPILLMKNPILYKNQSKNKLLSWTYFFSWCGIAIYHTFVIYGFCLALWYINSVILADNTSADFWCFSGAISHLLVLVINLKLLLNTRYQTVFFVVGDLLSILVLIMIMATYTSFNTMYDGDVMGTYNRLLGSLSFWLLNILVVVTCFAPDLAYMAVKNFLKSKKSIPRNDPSEITKL